MGTWGAAVFSDDTACDVRDQWREYVGDGLSAAQATDKLIREWGEALDDPDDGPVFWLALAAEQSRAGQLEERVKKKALAVIDDESNLERWREDVALLKKRRATLAKLREQLLTSQPKPKRIRKVAKAECEWEPGEVISFRLRSGKLLLFVVIEKVTDRGGTYPYCRFYDWTGDSIPARARVERLTVKPGIVMMCGATSRGYPADRIVRTGLRVAVTPPDSCIGVGVWPWNIVDQRLKEAWGLD